MPAIATFSGRKGSAFCSDCQDGVNGTTKAKAQIWADAHNLKQHPGRLPDVEGLPEGVDPEHAPGAAREIRSEIVRPDPSSDPKKS